MKHLLTLIYLFLSAEVCLAQTPLISMNGETTAGKYGQSVTSSDVNNDGYTDIIVGAPDYNSKQGRVYIYFGGSSMDNQADIILNGEAKGNNFGYSVTSGDMNQDGYDDVIIGAYNYNTHYGRVYIYFGSSSMDTIPDVILNGSAYSYFGYCVACAGDVNNDGFPDVIVGAPGFSAGNSYRGAAYLYYGSYTISTSPSVCFKSNISSDLFGSAVSSAGDVNLDGHSDIVIGASGYGLISSPSNYSGSVYVFLGGTVTNTVADMFATGTKGANQKLGFSVGSADVNGDGYSDILAGLPGISGNMVYIYYGNKDYASTTIKNKNIPSKILTAPVFSSGFGFSVANIGDVTMDDIDDILIGAPYVNYGTRTKNGQAYIYYGGALMNTVVDETITGQAKNDYFGWSVGRVMDVDGNGSYEIFVSAPYNDEAGIDTGKVSLYSYMGKPAELTYIIITPGTTTIPNNGTMNFTAQGYDQSNNPLPDLTYTWQTNIGNLSSTVGASTIFTAGTTALTGTLTVASNSISAIATITVSPGVLNYIIVSPAYLTIPVGSGYTFTAQGYDQYNNIINTLTYNWSVLSGTGSAGSVLPAIGTKTTFTSDTIPKTYTLTAKYSGIAGTATGTATIFTGGAVRLVITPGTATVLLGKTQTFTACNYDNYNNPIEGLSYIWKTSIGSLSVTTGTSTIFTASGTMSLTGTLTVTSGSITTTATLTITHGTLTYIIITPATATISNNGTMNFTAQGYDQSNQPLGSLTYTWQINIGSLSPTVGTSTLFTAGTTAITSTLTATSNSISGIATITIMPELLLDHIVVSPSYPITTVGSTQTITAQGYDQYNNLIQTLTYNWSVLGGTISNIIGTSTIFTSDTTPDTYILTAELDGIIGTSAIIATAGQVERLDITPATATLSHDETQTFTVAGYDKYNNPIEDMVCIWKTSIGSFSSTIGTSTIFTAGTTALTGTLTVTSGSITTAATVTIIQGTLSYIVITPGTVTLSTEGTKSFTAYGFDQYGNHIDDLDYEWQTEIGNVFPMIGTTTLFTGTDTEIIGTITASYGDIVGYATITISHGTLTYIVITPSVAELRVEDSMSFSAIGYDSFNKPMEGLVFDWQSIIGSVLPSSGSSTIFTAGTNAISGTLTATYGSLSSMATITLLQGTLSSIVITPLFATITVDATSTFTAVGYDSNNNAIEDLTGIWTTAAGNVSPSTGSSTTFTAGTKATTSGIISITSGTVTAIATITITSGSPAIISKTSGDNQSGPITVDLPEPFVIKLTDKYYNPIPNIPITFTITQVPDTAANQYLQPIFSITDTNGQAQTLFMLGNKTGTYCVLAMATGLTISGATFTAIGTLSSTRLFIEPETKKLGKNEEFFVDIKIADVSNLKSVQLVLQFDQTLLEVQDDDPVKSGIQISQGAFLSLGSITRNLADNSNGSIRYNFRGATGGNSGSGTIATIRFKTSNNVGTAIITISGSSTLLNSNATKIPFITGTGTINIVQEEVEGTAIISKPPLMFAPVYHQDILITASFGTTTTNSQGQFRFADAIPGTYTATATAAGAIPQAWNVVVNSGQITRLGTKTLYTGDADEDGTMNDSDYDTFYDDWDEWDFFGNYYDRSDCDRDGDIDGIDEYILDYNHTNPLPSPKVRTQESGVTIPVLLTVTSSTDRVQIGQTFTVTVSVSGVSNLYGIDYYFNFDNSRLEVVGIKSGDFPAKTRRLSYHVNKDNQVHFRAVCGRRNLASGEGILMTITFRAKADGVAFAGDLAPVNRVSVLSKAAPTIKFLDSNGNPMALKTNQLLINILVGKTTNFNSLCVYPNPSENGQGIHFKNLPAQTTIKIYNITGELVYEKDNLDDAFIWNCHNLNDRAVCSGIYIYILSNGAGIKQGKIAILR